MPRVALHIKGWDSLIFEQAVKRQYPRARKKRHFKKAKKKLIVRIIEDAVKEDKLSR